MNKKATSDALLALVNSSDRPEIARLREVFDSVEAAISAGVSHDAILAELHTQGFTMSKTVFQNAIYRIRKEGKPSEIVHKKRKPNPEPAKTTTTSHDPTDVSKMMSAPVDLDALSKKSKGKT